VKPLPKRAPEPGGAVSTWQAGFGVMCARRLLSPACEVLASRASGAELDDQASRVLPTPLALVAQSDTHRPTVRDSCFAWKALVRAGPLRARAVRRKQNSQRGAPHTARNERATSFRHVRSVVRLAWSGGGSVGDGVDPARVGERVLQAQARHWRGTKAAKGMHRRRSGCAPCPPQSSRRTHRTADLQFRG